MSCCFGKGCIAHCGSKWLELSAGLISMSSQPSLKDQKDVVGDDLALPSASSASAPQKSSAPRGRPKTGPKRFKEGPSVDRERVRYRWTTSNEESSENIQNTRQNVSGSFTPFPPFFNGRFRTERRTTERIWTRRMNS